MERIKIGKIKRIGLFFRVSDVLPFEEHEFTEIQKQLHRYKSISYQYMIFPMTRGMGTHESACWLINYVKYSIPPYVT